MAKPIFKMTLNEIVEWGRGELVLSIGAGTFEERSFLVIQQAYRAGFAAGKKDVLKTMRKR